MRGYNSTHAARAGIPGQPHLHRLGGHLHDQRQPTTPRSADQVWLSFDLYDSAESEYDILRTQVSTDGGTTWTTV